MEIHTPADGLRHWAATKPEHIFLRQADASRWIETSWQQAQQQVAQFAGYLKRYPKNSKIAILSNNCSDWFLADLAIMAAGHISIPIYPSASLKTICQILNHSETQLILVGKLSQETDLTQLPQRIDQLAIHKPQVSLDFWQQVSQSSESLNSFYQPTSKDIATIVYTSGTTGVPKGVVISYRAIEQAVKIIKQTIDLNEKDRFFSYLPLAHIMERMAIEITSVVNGSHVSFMDDLAHFSSNLQETRPSVFVAVPRIWVKLKQGIEKKLGGQWLFSKLIKIPLLGQWLKKTTVKKLGLDQVRFAVTGAAAISTDILNWWEELGVTIYEAYGLSETLGLANINRPTDRKTGSVGKVLEECQTMIAANGEILLKSACHMDGYYKEEELTSMAVQDGWFRTGDLGSIDEEGYLTIKGRVKEIFKTSKGKYISPVPIEQILEKEFQVDQACVFGSDLPQPIAVIVISDEVTSDRSFIKQCEDKLERINSQLEKHERLKSLLISSQEWTTDNEMMTPTLKIRRQPIEDYFLPKYHQHKGKRKIILLDA